MIFYAGFHISAMGGIRQIYNSDFHFEFMN